MAFAYSLGGPDVRNISHQAYMIGRETGDKVAAALEKYIREGK
jgi:hypothetical protein